MNTNHFRETLASQASQEKEYGKLIVISGISGSGKTTIADYLENNYNYKLIDKYVTRPFRSIEIQDLNEGKNIGIKAVSLPYNDGEKDPAIQSSPENIKKRSALYEALNLGFSYANYGNYYGFSSSELYNYISNGKNVVVIVNDPGLVKQLKDIFHNLCISILLFRYFPKNQDISLRIAEERGDTVENAKIRYDKSIKDLENCTGNITLYDYVLLNVENGFNKISPILKKISTQSHQKKETGTAKIYVFIGNPGSGKDDALEIVKKYGFFRSIIMPKHTTRERQPGDGIEIITPDNEKYNLNNCGLIYTNYKTQYGVDVDELLKRLNDGISSSIVLSNPEALSKLSEMFPGKLVKIYIHGLSKEEYFIQQKEHLSDPYVQQRLHDYENSIEFYYSNFFEIDHVLINNGDPNTLKQQIDRIFEYYESGRNLDIDSLIAYENKARRYMAQYLHMPDKEIYNE